MSDYIGDLSGYYAAQTGFDPSLRAPKDNASLDLTDFLSLMVAQFQNQSIDNTADTSDMLNQLVQMSMIEAITNITDATVMMYSGSLVGKEVTVGQYNSEGKLEEVVGTVTGTGVAGGQQVIFVDGVSYYLSDIMAVGRLPELNKPEGGDKVPEVKPEGGDKVPEVKPEENPQEVPKEETNPDQGMDIPGKIAYWSERQ